MSRKVHPADTQAAAQIAAATRFVIHFRKGPHETFNEEAPTLAAARIIADRLDAEHGQFGRRASIRAITAEGRIVPVPG